MVAYQASPTVYKNLILVGANVASENSGVGEPGDTRAYGARTGAKLWNYHSEPSTGEPGNNTWEGDGWKDRSGVHQWSFSFVVDAQRNLICTMFASPAYDYWGGDRKSDNLFGNSVVALDADTGKMKWYHQLVHHDLWDFDLPPTPVLLDVGVNGRGVNRKKVPIIAQSGKVGFMHILNRETGEPVFGIKETPVTASQVPGEQALHAANSVKPPPLVRRFHHGRSGHRRRHNRGTRQSLP